MIVIKLKLGKFNSTYRSKKSKRSEAVLDLLTLIHTKFKTFKFEILEVAEV